MNQKKSKPLCFFDLLNKTCTYIDKPKYTKRREKTRNTKSQTRNKSQEKKTLSIDKETKEIIPKLPQPQETPPQIEFSVELDRFDSNLPSDMFPNDLPSDMFPNDLPSDMFPNDLPSGSNPMLPNDLDTFGLHTDPQTNFDQIFNLI